jgi:hypothetical protein
VKNEIKKQISKSAAAYVILKETKSLEDLEVNDMISLKTF